MALALIFPTEEAFELESARRCRVFSPMPGGQMLVTLNGDIVDRRDEVESLVLTAYANAMS
jgi:hypothetical protein